MYLPQVTESSSLPTGFVSSVDWPSLQKAITLSTRFVADSVYGGIVTGTGTAGNQKVFAIVSPAS